MVDFASIANKPIGDIERPPLPPQGSYIFQVTKLPEATRSGDEKWDIVTFQARGKQALDDVDPEEIHKFGGPEKVFQSVRFMFNREDATEFARTEYNLRRFLEEHLKCATPDMSLGQGMNEAVNQLFVGSVKWRPDKNNPDNQFANIDRTAPVAD